jgi:hypothetical protein
MWKDNNLIAAETLAAAQPNLGDAPDVRASWTEESKSLSMQMSSHDLNITL